MGKRVYPTDNRIPHRVATVTVIVELTDRHGTNIEMLQRSPGLHSCHVVGRICDQQVIVVPTAAPVDQVDSALRKSVATVLLQLDARPDDTPEGMEPDDA